MHDDRPIPAFFLISIPDKFNITVAPKGLRDPEGGSGLREAVRGAPIEVFISPVGPEIVARQLEYLKKIRGTLESDLVSISSSFVCHVKNSSRGGYRIVGEFDDPFEESKTDSPIQSLVHKVATLVEEKETADPTPPPLPPFHSSRNSYLPRRVLPDSSYLFHVR